MTERQENKFTMMQTVDTLLDENAVIVGTIPMFMTKAAALKTNIADVHAKDQERGEALVGKAQDKYDAERALIEATIAVAGPMFAYGSDNGLNDVMETAHVTRGFLRHLRDTELPIRCKQVKDMANTHAGALAGYGATALLIANIDTKIAVFQTALGSRESATAERSGAVVSLKLLFGDGMNLLEQTDGIVQTLKFSQPQFYNEYFFARVIRDLGSSIHTFKGDVVATKNILSSGFGDTTIFSFQNPGTTVVRYCTGPDGTTACAAGVDVNPGQVILKRANEIGAPGSTFLNVTNLDAGNAGKYKVVRL